MELTYYLELPIKFNNILLLNIRSKGVVNLYHLLYLLFFILSHNVHRVISGILQLSCTHFIFAIFS